jgi:hypothetical protein
MTKSLLAASTLSLLVGACLKQEAAPTEIAKSIPTADQVTIKLPTASQNRTIGQLANWYVATRDITRTFNGGAAWVLVTVHSIVQLPVTSVEGNVYTWGPGSNALDPADYKLDVTAVGDGTYGYKLSGRSKTVAGAQFEVIIDGSADPRAGDDKGSGEFLIDFDAGRRVNPIDAGDSKGQVDAKYDLAAKHLDLTIMTTDANNSPVAADYAYNETADGGGNMQFDITGDTGGGPALENVSLNSRWLATGAGRADAEISGGDLGLQQVTASECWSTSFARTFYTDSANFSPTEGDAGSCAFTTAAPPSH